MRLQRQGGSKMILRIVSLLALGAVPTWAHDIITTKITWSREMSCHSPGQDGFSLLTYDDARPWSKAMKEETGTRRMPPWQAVKGFGDFQHDRGLTQEEIELISDWVEGGAPEGNPKFLPEKLAPPARWLDPDAPAGATAIAASTGFRLKAAARVVAVRPNDLKKGTSVQAIATRPDGTVEPLIWIYLYDPKFQRTYYYRAPINLPAGTMIEMSVPEAGILNLFSIRRQEATHELRSGDGGTGALTPASVSQITYLLRVPL